LRANKYDLEIEIIIVIPIGTGPIAYSFPISVKSRSSRISHREQKLMSGYREAGGNAIKNLHGSSAARGTFLF
jgi:hypothetical protein